MNTGATAGIILYFLLCLYSFRAQADGTTAWEEVFSGQHRFRDIGDNYSVAVPLRHIDGARLVLLDEELARSLGLTAPTRKELERRLEKTFSLLVSSPNFASVMGFATRYRDGRLPLSAEEMPFPDGDGRVVWLGSIKYNSEDGIVRDADVTLKGAGRTPLATAIPMNPRIKMTTEWMQYGDGFQTMSEAARSFAASQALYMNGCSTVGDLAVFELPFMKRDPLTKIWEKAALTLRVGHQFRPAQLYCFVHRPLEFRILLNFLIRQFLRLGKSEAVTNDYIETYLKKYAMNLVANGADLDDLNFVHGSLTASNLTYGGGIIDFGTLLTPDVAHREYLDSRGLRNFGVQMYQFRRNLLLLLAAMERSGYGWIKGISAEVLRNFDGSYIATSIEKRAKRLGLQSLKISELGGELLVNFYRVTEKILETKSLRQTTYMGQVIYPNAFDLNSILKGSLRVLTLPQSDQERAWVDLFVPQKSWSTTRPHDLLPGSEFHTVMSEYIEVVTILAQEIVKTTGSLNQGIAHAEAIGRPENSEALFPDTSKLLREIRNPWSSSERNTAMAMAVAKTLVEYRNCETALAKP